MKILAIDPGTMCGWAYFDGSQTSYGAWDLYNKRDEGVGYRYIRFKHFLNKMKDEKGIDLIFYEEVKRHAGVSAAHMYGAIVGHLQVFCEENKIPYKSIPIGTWKKHSIGSGNANKEKVLEVIKKKYPEIEQQDAADALGILQYVLEKELA